MGSFYCHLNATFINNTSSSSAILELKENPDRSNGANIERTYFPENWRVILELVNNEKFKLKKLDIAEGSQAINNLDTYLLRKLFDEDFRNRFVEWLFQCKHSETHQMVSPLILILCKLVVRRYKILSDSLRFENKGSDYVLSSTFRESDLWSSTFCESDLWGSSTFRECVGKYELLLLKSIFILGYKSIRDDKLNIEHIDDLFSYKEKRSLKEYYVEILKLVQAMYTIDSGNIQSYKEEMHNLFEIIHSWELFSDLQNECNTLLHKIRKHNSLKYRKNLENLMKSILKILETSINEKKITKQNINDLSCMLYSQEFKTIFIELGIASVIGRDHLVLRIEQFIDHFREHLKVYKQLAIIQEAFCDALSEIVNCSSTVKNLFFKPELACKQLFYAKMALIIVEEKESSSEEIEETCLGIVNMSIQGFITKDMRFPEEMLSLLHSVAEYMIRKGKIPVQESFDDAALDASLEEFLNKDEPLIKDIINLYIKIRSSNDLNNDERRASYLYIKEKLYYRIIPGDNDVLKINKAHGLFFAFYMMLWNTEPLSFLEKNYNTVYCKMERLRKFYETSTSRGSISNE